MTDWLLLTATLPTTPSALRVRIWRALKATGCGTLRDGVYLLPASASSAPAFWDIERSVTEGGAQAHMLALSARDPVQEKTFRALFDRSDAYAELLQSFKEARALLKQSTEVDLPRKLRALEQQFQALEASDFFPGKDHQRAAAALETLRREILQQLSPGEPTPQSQAIRRLALHAYQGKTWATRRRPWVDRLATAWLVRRFVDQTASFAWIDSPKKCPRTAVGFDFDGATFSHADGKVTFEVVMHSFGLDGDDALKGLGELVHYIDAGGIPVDAAAGVETVVRGLLAQHADDDQLLEASLPLFDSLYAAMRTTHD